MIRWLLCLLSIMFGAHVMGNQLDHLITDWEQFMFFLGLGFVCLGWKWLD